MSENGDEHLNLTYVRSGLNRDLDHNLERHAVKPDHHNKLGNYLVGNAKLVLRFKTFRDIASTVQLVLISPPFPLNHKKKYGNRTDEKYVASWWQSAIVALSILLLPTGPAGSASSHPFAGFFRGALDDRIPVTLSLAQDSERVQGILVYDRIGSDITVHGQVASSGALTLTETDPTGKQTGHWTLRFESDASRNVMTGRWNSASSRRGHAVRLSRETPLGTGPIAYAPLSVGESLYRAQTSRSIVWRLAPVGSTGLRFPQLIRLADSRIQARINQALARGVHELLSCGEATVTMSVWDFDAAITYADHDVFSIWSEGIGYCPGAAHPSIFNLSTTFDVRTGREMEFSELFANYVRDREQILKALFGDRIERARTADEGCASVYTLDRLSDIVYAFGRDGLIVKLEFGYVIAACAERVIVPYPMLKPFARPDGLLARVTG